MSLGRDRSARHRHMSGTARRRTHVTSVSRPAAPRPEAPDGARPLSPFPAECHAPRMTDFALDARLAGDTLEITDLALCRVLLMNDSQYPWCILVPRVEGAREIHRLDPAVQTELAREVAFVAETLERITGAFKMNVAALGNVVAQLHVHVVARFEGDAAWPAPVWGRAPRVPYADGEAERLIADLRRSLVRDDGE